MKGKQMDDSIMVVALKWLGGGALAAFGWVGKGMYADIKELKKNDADCKLDLKDFKLHVSENYAKDSTIQTSLARVYEVMEHGFKDQREYLKDMLNAKVGK